MGAYLSKPVTDKEVENSSDKNVSITCCSMQGWRTSQEDAHNAILDYKDGMSLFAVYDGHGGAEVAKLCADKLPDHIKNNEEFKKGNISESLINSFLEFDESILTKERQEVLKKLANIEDEPSENNSEPEENANLLREEAVMPLEQVLGKYLTEKEGGLECESNETESKKSPNLSKAILSSFLKATYGEKITLFGDKTEDEDDECDDDSEDYVANEEEENDEEEDDDDDDEEDEDLDEEDEEEEEQNGFMNPFEMMDNSPGFNSGTTAVLSLLDFNNNKIYVANAGDSRCVLCRNGTAIELSQDHKPEDKIESERIKKAGGILTDDGRVNGGLNLSRSIGDHFYKKNTELSLKEQMISALPDIETIDYKPYEDEFLVLACDGIWNSMTSQELVSFIKERIEKMELEVIVNDIFNHCLAPNTTGDGTGCDNMTCIIVQFKQYLLHKKSCNGDSENNLSSVTTNKRKTTVEQSNSTSDKSPNEKQPPPAKIRKVSEIEQSQ